jgi:alpha-tubulin suppressor-like RCC1 family protein
MDSINMTEQTTGQMSTKKSELQYSMIFDESPKGGLASAFQQEKLKTMELQKELESWKLKWTEYEEIHMMRQKQDAFETMIVSIENHLQDDSNTGLMNAQKRTNWENEAGMLLSLYQEDLKEQQDKYIQQLWVLYRKILPKIQQVDDLFLTYNEKLECYLNIVKLNSSNSTIEEQNTELEQDLEINNQDESSEFEDIKDFALKVIEDIDSKKIFDDIVIDFDNILDNVKPQEDHQKVNNMLVTYYEEIHEVLQKRLDECQDIIEEYMTELIENKKTELHQQMERYAMGEANNINPNKISDSTKNEITRITEDHNEKLQMLRVQYDFFLKNAENEFFNVLKIIKIEPSTKSQSDNSVIKSQNEEKEIECSNGELAKMAREFLARQKDNLKITEKNKIDHESVLKPTNTNVDRTCDFGDEYLNFKIDTNPHVKVNDLLNAKHAMSVFDFNPGQIDKENENDISSQTSYVDYNQEVKQNGFMLLSQDRRKNENKKPTASSYYGSTKKHLYYPTEAENKYSWGSETKHNLEDSKSYDDSLKNTQEVNEDDFEVICKGDHHSAGITDDGLLFTWGRGIFGQLGHGNDDSYNLPNLVSFFSKVQISQVSCGWQHTMALTKNSSEVYSWGYGKHGQLGHGDMHNSIIPKKIRSFDGLKVDTIDWGHSHSGAICDGEVFMWGCNTDCRLFLESSDNIYVPSATLMAELKREDPDSFYVVKISLGTSHSAVITISGELFTAGSNVDNQLGCRSNDSVISETNSQDPEGTLFSPLNQVLPYGDEHSPLVIEVKCGDWFTMVLDDRNQVQIFGKSSEEQESQNLSMENFQEPLALNN